MKLEGWENNYGAEECGKGASDVKPEVGPVVLEGRTWAEKEGSMNRDCANGYMAIGGKWRKKKFNVITMHG
jgi:hypothetical protein